METERKKIAREVEDAYHDRDDYPPFALNAFEDRARYHQFVLKIIRGEK